MDNPQDNLHHCADEDLGAMMERLFSEGHDEIEVQHPVDGTVIVTKIDFKQHLKAINDYNNASSAERIEAKKRLKNIKNAKQVKFRTMMIESEVHTVDVQDESSFGKTVDGVQLDIDGLMFIGVADYLDGINIVPNELGAFFDEDNERPPVRIKQQQE